MNTFLGVHSHSLRLTDRKKAWQWVELLMNAAQPVLMKIFKMGRLIFRIRFISYDNETDRNGGLFVAIDLGLDPV